MKKIILMTLIFVIMQSVCFAADPSNFINGKKDTINHVHFLEQHRSADLTQDLSITFQTMQLESQISDIGQEEKLQFYYGKERMLLNTFLTRINLNGIKVAIVNYSDHIYVIQWANSSISFGNFTGIPFLDGMKYKDAGNPAATPDSIIPPKTIVYRTLYTSNVEFSNGDWSIKGEWIPTNNSMIINVYLKILDNNNLAKYYSAESPYIGVEQ